MKTKLLKITDFSKASGLSKKALRLYEEHGVLVPTRADSNRYRLYSEAQIQVAKEIRIMRQSGFSTREISALLPFRSNPNGTLGLLRAHLSRTNQAIATHTEQRDRLRELIRMTEKKGSLELKGNHGLFARQIVCRQVSESIKKLSEKEIIERTRLIPNGEFLRTVAMVDDIARARLLSTISDKAAQLVSADLAQLDVQYANFWK